MTTIFVTKLAPHKYYCQAAGKITGSKVVCTHYRRGEPGNETRNYPQRHPNRETCTEARLQFWPFPVHTHVSLSTCGTWTVGPEWGRYGIKYHMRIGSRYRLTNGCGLREAWESFTKVPSHYPHVIRNPRPSPFQHASTMHTCL